MDSINEEAAAELRAAGYEPLEPYPGKPSSHWRVRCVECGAERRPRLADIHRGRRCRHKRKARRLGADPEAELRAAGYVPLDPYPGGVLASWRAVCAICGAERRPTLNHVRQGIRCKHAHSRWTAVQPEVADAELCAAGYEPLEPYPGSVKANWRARCTVCGAARKPNIDALRNGRRCKHGRLS